MEVEGELKNEFVDCLCLSVSDAFFSEISDKTVDDETASALELIPGRYWRTGSWMGKPLWRQELSMI